MEWDDDAAVLAQHINVTLACTLLGLIRVPDVKRATIWAGIGDN